MDMATIDKLTDDMADLQADIKDISDALATNPGVGADDDELNAEFAALEEQMAAEALMGASSAPSGQKTADPLEAEFARMQAEQQAAAGPMAMATAPPA